MDYKNLSRKLQATVADIQKSEDVLATVYAMLQRLVDDFRSDLGIVGGRIYERQGPEFVLRKEFPPGKAPLGFRIPMSYEPARELIEHGIVRHNINDPGVDQQIMNALGVETFAAIGVGGPPNHIIAFSLEPDADPEQVVYTLTTIRHVINLRLRQIYLEDRVAASRAIQMSLLPRLTPDFGEITSSSPTASSVLRSPTPPGMDSRRPYRLATPSSDSAWGWKRRCESPRRSRSSTASSATPPWRRVSSRCSTPSWSSMA
jgi:hypothetical protein